MKALVRRPSPRLAEGVVTHVERRQVDVERAVAQWEAYVDALRVAGWETIELPPADDCPDGVFVEDVLVVHEGFAVITRPGVGSRLPETAGLEGTLAALGYRVERIREPATLDGGDVLFAADTVFVGTGGRTNTEGATQLGGLLEANVVEVPVDGALHLKTTRTLLPDGTPVEGNVLPLGGKQVLVASAELADAVRERGYEPVKVDISEFEKLEGGVTCLSVLTARAS